MTIQKICVFVNKSLSFNIFKKKLNNRYGPGINLSFRNYKKIPNKNNKRTTSYQFSNHG